MTDTTATRSTSSTSRASRQTRRIALAVATAAGITTAVAGCSGGNTAAPSGSAPAPASPPAASAPAKHHQGVTGKISAINGSTWTIHTAQGKDINVTLTPRTQYGTKAAPANAGQFNVGDTVRVAGTRDQDTVTATRVATPRSATAAHNSTSPAPTNS
ncbi:MAG: hypothetical protein JO100_13725 [Pseudonocardia sp.]|nr:hypothetical protein [Pseudonocardia sp.]